MSQRPSELQLASPTDHALLPWLGAVGRGMNDPLFIRDWSNNAAFASGYC